MLGDSSFEPWRLRHGVPQGSILSPMLFNIDMKPLEEVIRRFGLRSQQYADDTQLYLSFSTNPGVAVASLNSCLDSVMSRMRVNKLRLSSDKSKVLLVCAPPDRLKGHFPDLDGVTLAPKGQGPQLGGAP